MCPGRGRGEPRFVSAASMCFGYTSKVSTNRDLRGNCLGILFGIMSNHQICLKPLLLDDFDVKILPLCSGLLYFIFHGFREDLQETIEFPSNKGLYSVKFSLNQSIDIGDDDPA